MLSVRRITNQNKILPYSISDVEDVSGKRVTGLIGVLKLRDLFVATPDRYFPRLGVRGIVLAGDSKVDEIVFRRPLSAREVLGETAAAYVQVSLDRME